LRFCIALWKCAASSMPTFAHGDSLSPIAWHPHCLFLRANRPAIASQISPLCYPLPIGKRNPTPFSRNVLLSTIAVYIMLLCSTTQHQRVRQARPIAQGRRPGLLRLATATATARQGKAPCQAERSGGRDKASHPRRQGRTAR
jgi:hypothetical protein